VPDRSQRGTLLDYVERNAAEHSGVVALVDGERLLTWAEYLRKARAVALALLDLGVGRGSVVGLHMVNRAEHVLADVGALFAGAIPTSFYNTLAPEQLAFVAADSAAHVVIVDADQLPYWLAIRDQLPDLRHIVAVDLDLDQPPPAEVRAFEDLLDIAEAELEQRGAKVDRARAEVAPKDTLTLVYTSGTTGPPKGTVITHAGALQVAEEVGRQLGEHLGGPVPVGWTSVSYLPLAHVAERMFSHYLAQVLTITVTYVRSMTELPRVLPMARPYLFLGMPRIWERMHGAIRERAVTSRNPVRRTVVGGALAAAGRVGRARLDGGPVGFWTSVMGPIREHLVYSRLRAALGLDRVVLAVSGAAPLPADLMVFFAGIGITIIEVYGMTETAAMITASPLAAPRPGSVGQPIAPIELKIAEDGEVLVRGANVTPGYLNRPEATAEALDSAGWLYTGDIGSVDDDGYLFLTGRKKELINTASGKTISPGNVESTLSAGSDLIGSVYVHGDAKPCLVALVTLDASNWRPWCEARGIEVASLADAVADGRVRLEVARSIGAGNAQLSRVEQVKNWTLLAVPWGSETGELTPTLKLRRPIVAERYRDEIEQLYDPLTAESWSDD
jgi:long-chain acyl-CoA synthetase